MKTILSAFLFASLILGTPSTNFADTPLKVGFIGGFTGPGKVYGEACKNGFLMGLGDGYESKIQVIFEDDQFVPAQSVSAFKKLTDLNKIDIAISIGSGPGNALAPIAEQKHIPLISWGSDPKIALNRSLVFRSWVKGQVEGERIADEAMKMEARKMAFISTVGEYNQSVLEGFKQRLPSERLGLSEEYPPDANNFKPFLGKVKARNLAAIGLCLNPGQSGLIGKQAKELGMELGFFGCETLNDFQEYKDSNGALLNAWFVTGGVEQQFVERYREKFGGEDMISGAAVHYDIARSIILALGETRGAEQIAAFIRNVKVQGGALGDYGIVVRRSDQFFDINLVTRKLTAQGIQ